MNPLDPEMVRRVEEELSARFRFINKPNTRCLICNKHVKHFSTHEMSEEHYKNLWSREIQWLETPSRSFLKGYHCKACDCRVKNWYQHLETAKHRRNLDKVEVPE